MIMKNSNEKRFSCTILAASIAAIGLTAPLNAQAEESSDDIHSLITPDSKIEAGIGNVSGSSYKFGDYGRGMKQSGAYMIGNIQMNARGENNAHYLEIIGRNLGLDGSRDINIKGGEQGNYGLSFGYDELSKLYSDSFQTPYTGMGYSRLTQPAGWAGTIDTVPGGVINAPVGATIVTTPMMTALAANMKKFNIETRRRATSFGLTKQIMDTWSVVFNYKRDEKNGTQLIGLPMQIGGGGSRGTLLAPEPINYTNDLFDVLARYADEKLQLQFAYNASLFKNANKSLAFDNLFYNAVSTVGGNALTGQIGQMPDNQFHQVNASGSYTFSKETSLTGKVSLGRMTQNEAFLPYSTAAAPGILPVASLNGRIDTAHADIKLNSKLSHAFNFTAGYKYDDRDNRTPVNTYTYFTADSTTVPGLSNTRRNTPLSNTKQMIYADIDYHFSAATLLKFGYEYEQVKHTYEATSGDRENTIKAEVKHNFGEMTSAGLGYAHSDRKASAYNGAAPLSSTYAAAYLASLCVTPNTFIYNGAVVACTLAPSATNAATTPFLDTPSLRKFFLADRRRDKLNAFANVSPSEKLDLQLGSSYYNEKYPDTEAGFGLTGATGWSANLDANLAVTDKVNGIVFASLDSYRTAQNGHNGASNAGAGITTLDRQNNTTAFNPLTGVTNLNDRSQTLGIGFNVKPGGSYEWGGNFTHTSTTSSATFSNLGALLTTVLPVPDTISRLNRLELFGKFKLQKNLMLNVKYMFEKFNSSDWAWNGQTLTSSTSFIGSGQTSPNYKVHVIGALLSYSF